MPGHSQFLLLLSLRFFVVVYLFGGFVCFFCTSNIIQGIHTWQSCWRLKIKRKWNKCYQFFISIQVKTETIKYIKYFFFPFDWFSHRTFWADSPDIILYDVEESCQIGLLNCMYALLYMTYRQGQKLLVVYHADLHCRAGFFHLICF